ncbi:N-6 DNA methylase [Flavobacterium circumlabens]|uniref:N-6 DNA methylase n=1 Tax=Flavobacterium circumlabens TaxID=2133765 RepID=A0ABY2B2A0_9FLAO|nr:MULTISPECIES: N-6 DNA methylase [Flavobacterium]TCN59629.1 N-6 DNA methylase [Flavobacterium circumlabens]
MAFNKREHLKKNIEALQLVFLLEKEKRQATENERQLLMKYSGFGGLKFVLNPADKADDLHRWVKSEQDLFALTQELHQVLRENALDEKQYHRYLDSIRASVLTAFYTPPAIIDAIANSFLENQIPIERFLEPSAGRGSFIEAFKNEGISHIAAYEKDLLTGKILKQLYPDNNIRVAGFEEIPDSGKETYDIIASNIPFGDTSVFDLSFIRSKNSARMQAARSIHNYFFIKSVDMLRDGGILAFITSQGVLNSAKNEPIREALMQSCNLVSAIRLPNNLFTDYAGTEVGSDLIVLQKNKSKSGISQIEQQFCKAYITSENINNNLLFAKGQRIVHTSLYEGTNQYGKPSWIYEHKDGV